MAKQLTFLCALLFLMAGVTMGQHYQFPNPSFSNWTSTSSNSAVPRGWHSFSDAEGSWAWATGNHSNTAQDRFGNTQHACQIYSKYIALAGVNANGAMTLGQMVVASASSSSDDNLIYTKRKNNQGNDLTDSVNGRWSMAGRPDSVRIWAKFDMASNSSVATCKMHIHGNVDYQDIPSHQASTPQTGKIANTFCTMTKNHGVVSYGSSNNLWERFDFKFTYYDNNNNVVTNPTLTNITQATQSFILASFSTNEEVGGGSANDKLYFDDLELVYNKKLASLSIGGTAISASDLLALNNTAFGSAVGDPHTAYNIFNTQGLAVYEYNQPVCAGAFPEVSATAESGLINGITYSEATVSNPYTTIVVTHNDGSYYTYKVHFANVQSSPNVTLDNGGSYFVCQHGSLTMTASGDAASYAWSNGLGNSSTATPPTGTVGTTTYTVTGFTSNGCTTTATATVTVNPLPSVTLSNNHDQTVCSGTAINNITATIGGGSASGSNMLGLSFNANNGIIQGTPNGSGQYTITVTSTYTPSCGTASASGIITVNPAPTASLSLTSVTACSGSEITPVTATTSGGTVTPTLPAGLNYNPETGEITGIPEAAGTITIATVSTNCGTATASCPVTITPAPSVSLSNNKNQTLCNSNQFTPITVSYANGSVDISGLTGTGLSYANGHITGNPTTGSHTYYVTVTSQSGCGSVRDTGTVTVSSTPTVTLTPSSISVCQGSAIEGVTISPYNDSTAISGLPSGVSFDYSSGHIIGTPSVAGSYPITVTTVTNCGTATTNGTITVKPLPTVNLSNSNIEVCDGEQISPVTVTATNAANSTTVNLSNGLQFSGLNNNTGTITGIPTTAGAFTITVNSNNQCGTASAEGTVTIKTKPTVSINGPESLCQGVTETLTAEGDFISCVWDDNSTNTTLDITPDHAGQFSYSVTATGSNGCTNNATTTVNVQASPATPNANVVNNTNCSNPNGSITVNSPTGNYTYSINGTDFQESTIFSNLQAGSYTLTVKNAAGCTATKDYTITSVGSTVIAQAQAQNPCDGGDLTLNGSSNASSGVTYAWSGPDGTIYNGQNPTIENVTTANNGTYTLTVTETATGCTSTASVTVTVRPQPSVIIAESAANPSVCPGTSFNIMVDGQNGTLSASNLPGGVTLANGFISGSVSTPGTYNYTVTNTSDCGTATASGTITVYDLPTITFTGTNSFCQGSSTTIGMQEQYNNYTWSFNNNHNSSITVSTAGDYTVTVTDSHGCQNSATQTVTMNPLPATPTVSIAHNTNCTPFNGSITVTAPLGNYTYSIYGGEYDDEDFQESPVFSGLESEEYTITVKDGNGCQSSYDGIFVDDFAEPYSTSVTVDNAVNSYVWNGTTYTESGDYSVTLTASNGCDSTVTLHLTIISTITQDITEIACDSYTWEGETYTTSGDYSHTFEAASGVDSVVTLHLTINHSTTGTETVTACDSYEWHGNIYTKSNNTATYTTTNAAGCDSVVTLNLTINHSTTGVEAVTACDSYEWHGNTYTENNNSATYTTTNAVGCDSVVTLNLTINHSSTGIETVTACDSYEWHGNTFTESNNTATYTTTNAAGCDSVVTLNLTINHSTTGTDTQVACDSYTWIDGNTYTNNNNTATYTTTNAAGCDSVVTLNLTINRKSYFTDVQTACNSYTWIDGNTYTESNNTATHTLTNAAGCDSVVTLNLTIYKPANQAYHITRCETYTWTDGDGQTYTQSGTHTHAHTDANGCEQVDTLYLTINALPTVTITGETSFCEGSSTTLTATEGFTYLWNDDNGSTNQTLTVEEGGEYIVTVTDGNNCQNTASVLVNVLAKPATPVLLSTDNTSCEDPNGVITVTNATSGLSYSINGTNFQTATTFNAMNAGTYTVTVKNADGCTNYASVTVNNTDNTLDATATSNTPCVGDTIKLTGTTSAQNVSFSWTGPNDFTSNEQNPIIVGAGIIDGGDYNFTVTDPATHCSMTSAVTVTVNAPAVTLADIANKTACEGDTVTFNATQTGTSTGTVSYSWSGPNDFSSNQQNITLNNITAAQGGVYTVTATASISNCTATNEKSVTLSVNQPSTGTDEQTACNSYTWINGITYSESTNEPTITLQAANGCDSVVTLHLTIYKPTHQAFPVTAYDSYTWTDGDGQTYTASGDHIYSHLDDNGCTQVDTLHLTIYYSASNQFYATACESYTWNDSVYTTSGDYVQHFKTVDNADSTVTLHLTIHHGTHNVETMTACESFIWHGTTYTTSGDYTYDYNNANGCASTDTLHLTINNPQHQAYTETAYDSYTWNDSVYTTSGDYTFSHQDANGCTQVDTLHLTIYQSAENEFSATSCESYTWNDSVYTTSGDYVQHFKTVDNADSTVTLHLTIHHGTHNVETMTACESFIWHGTTYTTSGDYTYDYNNANGCASTDTLHLTINNPQHQAYTETAYDSYTWNDSVYTTSGDYTFSHQDANGCTQVDTLHLTIYQSAENEFSATSCESYTWNDSVYTTSGDYVQHFKTVDNADSTVTLHLTIHHGTHNVETMTACESFIWHGTTYTTSGDYTYDYNNANGCASTDTLHLTINNPQHQAYTETAYDSYTWNDSVYTTSGDYTFSHQDANGCTQVDTLHLTIYQSAENEFSATSCESYTWNDSVYTTSGDYVQHFKTVDNADSTVTLHLTIHHGTHNVETMTACESFIWHGTTYTTSGDYTYDYNNANGCASTDTLHLTINNPQHQAYTETAYDSYTWNDSVYTTSGDYTFSHQDANGCTQVDTLHLTILHGTIGDTTAVACESFDWYEHINITESCEDLTHTFTASNGADSVVTLHLTILKPTVGTLIIEGNEAVCEGESATLTASVTNNNGTVTYIWNTQEDGEYITFNPTETNEYSVMATATLTVNDVTCTATSEESFTVTVNIPTTGDTTATACETFDWYEHQNITASGDFTHTFVGANINGCDSVVTLHLTINNIVSADTFAVKCNTFDWYDHTNITESCDNLTHTFQMANGCDSVVTLHLTILKPAVGTLTISGDNVICQGESTELSAAVDGNNGNVTYVWNNDQMDATITINPTETTDFTVTATATLTEGDVTCTATAEETFTVTVNQHTTGIDVQNTCDESFNWYEHTNITESCDYLTHTLEGANVNGCDSIVTLILTMRSSSHIPYSITECDAFEWHNSTYTSSGTYLYEYTNEQGCPSVDTLHLTINNGTHQSFYVEACEEYEWHDMLYTESGIYTYTHEVSIGDCPDVDTLHLTINKPVDIDTTIQVCFFPYTFEGREYTEPTTDEFTITTIDGSCDSVIYHITVSEITSMMYDGHEYPVLKIGSDCWFAENLRIEEGLSDVSAYMNDESYVEKFGRLYNWYDAIGETQPQGAKADASGTAASACPEGWTIPTVTDFENLFAAADDNIANLKSPDVTTWFTGAAGSPDGIGFNAPAGGYYNPASLQFERLLLSSQYWTSNSGSNGNEMTSAEISYHCSTLLFHSTPKDAKLSIRCVKIK